MLYTEINTMSALLNKAEKIKEIVHAHNNEVISNQTEDGKKYRIANDVITTFYAPPECPCDTPLTLLRIHILNQEWASAFCKEVYKTEHLIYKIENVINTKSQEVYNAKVYR